MTVNCPLWNEKKSDIGFLEDMLYTIYEKEILKLHSQNYTSVGIVDKLNLETIYTGIPVNTQIDLVEKLLKEKETQENKKSIKTPIYSPKNMLIPNGHELVSKNPRTWKCYSNELMTTEIELMRGLQKNQSTTHAKVAETLNFYFKNNRTASGVETAKRRGTHKICSQTIAQEAYNFYERAKNNYKNYNEAINELPWNARKNIGMNSIKWEGIEEVYFRKLRN